MVEPNLWARSRLGGVVQAARGVLAHGEGPFEMVHDLGSLSKAGTQHAFHDDGVEPGVEVCRGTVVGVVLETPGA
jgi:hypothetical protein